MYIRLEVEMQAICLHKNKYHIKVMGYWAAPCRPASLVVASS